MCRYEGLSLRDYLTMDEIDVEGKTVLLRVDINSEVIDGKVTMNERIREHGKTMKELSEKKARVVVLAHQGRVGEKDFLPLEQHSHLLENFVHLRYIDDIIGPAAIESIRNLKDGEVLLLDNVRMLAEETIERSPEEHSRSFFVRKISPLADIFINDALSVSHRSHASVVGFPKILDAAVGRLMEKELKALERAVCCIERPCVYVLGGAKPGVVLDIMESSLERVDSILTMGVIGNIFLYASGAIELDERDKHLLRHVERARAILKRGGDKIKYPVDIATEVDGLRKELQVDEIKRKPMYDIGEKTCEEYADIIKEAKTIVMKGPAGLYEKEAFKKGTREILKAISASNAFSLIGGGHTSAAISAVGMDKKDMSNTYISLAGGALLMYLSGKKLPGVEVLRSHSK